MGTINHSSGIEAQYRIYGAPTGVYDEYLDRRREKFMQGVSDSSAKFFKRVRSVVDVWHGEEAIRRGQKALRKVKAHVNREDVIQPLTTFDDLVFAREKMQAMILSHPELRKRHRRMEITAYSIGFEVHHVDRYPDIYDGVVRFDDDGSEYWEKVLYVEGHNDHLRLSLNEQEDIIDTFEFIDSLDLNEKDPTCEN